MERARLFNVFRHGSDQLKPKEDAHQHQTEILKVDKVVEEEHI